MMKWKKNYELVPDTPGRLKEHYRVGMRVLIHKGYDPRHWVYPQYRIICDIKFFALEHSQNPTMNKNFINIVTDKYGVVSCATGRFIIFYVVSSLTPISQS